VDRKKLPHRLVLAEFLSWLAKIYTLAASYDKFLNACQLEIQKRTSQCAVFIFGYFTKSIMIVIREVIMSLAALRRFQSRSLELGGKECKNLEWKA